MSGKLQVFWSVVLAAVALTALPVAAQAQSSTVTITVLPTQLVEGATSLTVPAGAPPQRGRLVVKSNISWVLVAHSTGAPATVAWKASGKSDWQDLSAATPVLQGGKGVQVVEYMVRLDPRAPRSTQSITVTFTVEAAR